MFGIIKTIAKTIVLCCAGDGLRAIDWLKVIQSKWKLEHIHKHSKRLLTILANNFKEFNLFKIKPTCLCTH